MKKLPKRYFNTPEYIQLKTVSINEVLEKLKC